MSVAALFLYYPFFFLVVSYLGLWGPFCIFKSRLGLKELMLIPAIGTAVLMCALHVFSLLHIPVENAAVVLFLLSSIANILFGKKIIKDFFSARMAVGLGALLFIVSYGVYLFYSIPFLRQGYVSVLGGMSLGHKLIAATDGATHAYFSLLFSQNMPLIEFLHKFLGYPLGTHFITAFFSRVLRADVLEIVLLNGNVSLALLCMSVCVAALFLRCGVKAAIFAGLLVSLNSIFIWHCYHGLFPFLWGISFLFLGTVLFFSELFSRTKNIGHAVAAGIFLSTSCAVHHMNGVYVLCLFCLSLALLSFARKKMHVWRKTVSTIVVFFLFNPVGIGIAVYRLFNQEKVTRYLSQLIEALPSPPPPVARGAWIVHLSDMFGLTGYRMGESIHCAAGMFLAVLIGLSFILVARRQKKQLLSLLFFYGLVLCGGYLLISVHKSMPYYFCRTQINFLLPVNIMVAYALLRAFRSFHWAVRHALVVLILVRMVAGVDYAMTDLFLKKSNIDKCYLEAVRAAHVLADEPSYQRCVILVRGLSLHQQMWNKTFFFRDKGDLFDLDGMHEGFLTSCHIVLFRKAFLRFMTPRHVLWENERYGIYFLPRGSSSIDFASGFLEHLLQ